MSTRVDLADYSKVEDLADYSKVDIRAPRRKSVNFRAGKSPGEADWLPK
jgi:hypothetical protein